MEAKKLIVGIDFGTSTTVVRYRVDGSDVIQTIKDKNGASDVIPTVIFKQNDGQCVYGHEALSLWQSDMDGELISNFKMGLIDKNEDVRREKAGYIQEFLIYVYALFEQQTQGLNATEWDIYVSYPAKWDHKSVVFMKEAVTKAGFGVNIQGWNEPKAAVVNYLHTSLKQLKDSGMLKESKPINVFMLDMGAGTSDIVIFRLTISKEGTPIIEDQMSYPKADNPYLCGGCEIDIALSEYVKDYVKRKSGKDVTEILFTQTAAKEWKEQSLSNQLKKNNVVGLPVSVLAACQYIPNGKSVKKDFAMRRNDFEEITQEHWKKLYALISSAINDYKDRFNIGAEDIDLLLLTGAHSQWYTVNNLFNGEGVAGYIGKKNYKIGNTAIGVLNFGKLKEDSSRIFSDALPHESVAKGLVAGEHIEIHSFAPNNVWMQININGEKSETIQVVTCGQELPSPEEKILFSKTFRRNNVFGEHSFSVTLDIYTGESLGSALRYKMTYIHSNFLRRMLLNLIPYFNVIQMFLHTKYEFCVDIEHVRMNEDGALYLIGCIRTFRNGSLKDIRGFTLDDFHEEVTQNIPSN